MKNSQIKRILMLSGVLLALLAVLFGGFSAFAESDYTQCYCVVDECPDDSIGCPYSYDDFYAMIPEENAYYLEPYDGSEKTEDGSWVDVKYIFGSSSVENGMTIQNKWFYSDNEYPCIVNRATIDWYEDRGTKTSNVCAFLIQNRSNVTFENCVFENISAVNALSCDGITFRNCLLYESRGFHFKDTSNITIENCTIVANSSGTYASSLFYIGMGCDNISIDRCKIISQGINGKAFRFGNNDITDQNGNAINGSGKVTNARVTNCYVCGVVDTVLFVLNDDSEVTVSNVTADLYCNHLNPLNNAVLFSQSKHVTVSDSLINLDTERLTNSKVITVQNVTWNVVERPEKTHFDRLQEDG